MIFDARHYGMLLDVSSYLTRESNRLFLSMDIIGVDFMKKKKSLRDIFIIMFHRV